MQSSYNVKRLPSVLAFTMIHRAIDAMWLIMSSILRWTSQITTTYSCYISDLEVFSQTKMMGQYYDLYTRYSTAHHIIEIEVI